MKKYIGLVVFIFVISFSFTLLFPIRYSIPRSFILDGVIDINSNYLSSQGISEGFVHDNKSVTFFSLEDNTVTYRYTVENHHLLSNKFGFITYDTVSNISQIYDNKGNLINTIIDSGTPLLFEELPNLYFQKDYFDKLSLYTIDGKKIFDNFIYNFPITSIHSDKYLNTVIGLDNGDISYFDSDGKSIFSKSFATNENNIIKNISLDTDGRYCALNRLGSGNIIEVYDINVRNRLFYQNLDTNEQTALKFYQNKLYYNNEGNVVGINLHNNERISFSFEGDLIDFKVNNDDSVAIISNSNDMNYMYIYRKNANILYYNEFSDKVSNLSWVSNENLYILFSHYVLNFRIQKNV